jgi:Txe/YoeB family toxin of toxin-antitoxin system
MNYKIELTKRAQKDLRNLKSAGLNEKAKKIRNVLRLDPYPNISKELLGDLAGKRSIRINLQHRIVYEVLEEEKVVKVLRMWGHYED